jgi:sugar lactone lactonase YvrE
MPTPRYLTWLPSVGLLWLAAAAPAAAQSNPAFAPGDVLITEFFEDLWHINPATGSKTAVNPGTLDIHNIVEFDASRRLVAIDVDNRLVRFDPVTRAVAPLTSTLFPLATDIAVEQSGTILVTAGNVFRVNPATGATSTLVDKDMVNDGFFNPFGVDVGPTGQVFVSEFFESLWEINPSTGAAAKVPTSREIDLRDPLEVRSDGTIISREFPTGNFLKINPATAAVTNFATDVPTFVHGIALEADDDLLVTSDSTVYRYNAATGAKTTLTPGATFFAPGGITVAPAGGVTSPPADFDGDGDVDGVDLARWEGNYGMTTAATKAHGNADGDADVDGRDFLVWQRHTNGAGSAATAAAVPEPAAFPLAVAALTVGMVCHPRRGREALRPSLRK